VRVWILRGCLLAAAVVAGALVRSTAAETERLGGWIVYWRESPIPSIWAVRPNGTHNHRILRSRQNAKRPRLSPDRRWVAFDGTPPGKPPLSDFDIQVVRMNGRDRRTLTSSSDWDIDAQWSPDGQSLSFTRSPPSPLDCTDHSIWLMHRDGSDARRVVDGCAARWSPDGTKLVYASTDGRSLLVVETTGGAPQLLLSGPAHAYEKPADWSPDGKKILFTRSYGQNGTNGYVFVMNADGTRVRRLSRGFAGSWSPDGKKILYTKSFWWGLFVMNADGSHKRRILATEASQADWR
jgi:Tol biopolymer transport system component